MRFYPSCILRTYILIDAGRTLGIYLLLRNFNTLQERSFEEWSSILDLSTRWGFTSVRDLALRCANPPSAYHRLLLARKHAIDQWILPALSELCERPQPLSVDEARLMDVEDIVLVGSVRESVRSHALSVNSAEIKDCIEAWKKGEPWSPIEEDAPETPASAIPAAANMGFGTPHPLASAQRKPTRR
jgi:hypothetical protein